MPKTTSTKGPQDGAEPIPPADEAAVVEDQAAAPAPVPDAPAPAPDAPEQQPGGVYEYVHGIGCVYPHVPLTCHAHQPAVPATDSTPEIPERAATVFDWPDGPPDDGRWARTRKRPNQAADNAGGLLSSKE
ncbi:hypothetical protein ABZ883_40595 [Streptomyces sp. NPDC046977]|uniref:hypothetical protein n=1 Tax=Streptomyces sp. NPDC046977 TaxID=3154703 RepID=UPI0033D4569A